MTNKEAVNNYVVAKNILDEAKKDFAAAKKEIEERMNTVNVLRGIEFQIFKTENIRNIADTAALKKYLGKLYDTFKREITAVTYKIANV
tara:strand:+ start:48 stop:314 length:267 start_codon:yes stop_codon:yes gene_type:complete